MGQRILGLDIGSSNVKGVLVESAYRSWTVLAAVRSGVAPETAGGPPLRERQVEAVRQLVASLPHPFDSALVALPGPSSSHLVTLPFADARRIEQTLPFEVENQIPFDLAEVAWDWQVLRSAAERTDVLVPVVRKEDLAGLLADLAAAGVDPRAVIPPGPAYAALFEVGAVAADAAVAASLPEPGAPRVADVALDVGVGRASVCVVVDGACEAARTFPASPGSLAGLVREVRATLRAWRARSGPDAPVVRRIVLVGENALAPGLLPALASEAAGPVAPLVVAGPAAAGVPPADAPAFALALALALRGTQGARAPRLNLRRGDLAYTRDFEHLRGKVLRLGAWAALVVLLAMLSSAAKVFALSRQEALLDRALCEATQKLVGKCYDNDELAVAALKGKGTLTSAVPRDSAFDVFMELSQRTPSDMTLKYDRIEITRDKLHLQGVTDAAESVDRIVSALRTSRCFGDARSGGARKRSSDGRFEFTIDSDLTCEPGEKPTPRS